MAASTPTPNDSRVTGLLEWQNALRRCIDTWHDTEQEFIPSLASLRADLVQPPPASQTLCLLLPLTICSSVAFPDIFLTYEWRLWEGQAYDALASIRGYLEVVAYVTKYPRTCRTMGEDIGHWANLIVSSVRDEIDMEVRHYNDTYAALLKLAVPLGDSGLWKYLRQLVSSDVRYITESDVNGRQPWIWNFGGTLYLKPEDLHDIKKNKNLCDGK